MDSQNPSFTYGRYYYGEEAVSGNDGNNIQYYRRETYGRGHHPPTTSSTESRQILGPQGAITNNGYNDIPRPDSGTYTRNVFAHGGPMMNVPPSMHSLPQRSHEGNGAGLPAVSSESYARNVYGRRSPMTMHSFQSRPHEVAGYNGYNIPGSYAHTVYGNGSPMMNASTNSYYFDRHGGNAASNNSYNDIPGAQHGGPMINSVYAPTWFQIKKNELAVNGPKNFFFLMKKSNVVDNYKAKMIIQKCIRRNAFFAHSENVLLAQLTSQKQSCRIDAGNKILTIRDRNPDRDLRLFKVPTLNFNARSWTDMTFVNDSSMTEPPFTLQLSEDVLNELVDTPLEVPKFKCHTQMVERAVKEVTRVSKTVISQEKRNSMIKLTLINRAMYPKFESKKDFSLNDSVSYLPKI